MFHVPAHKHVGPNPPAQVPPPAPATPADFIVANHGSVLVLTPMTDEGKDWVEENLPADSLRFGRGVVIEPRYFGPIQDGIWDAGLAIAD